MEKGAAEDEMIREYHRLNGHEIEQHQGDSGGQRSLAATVVKSWTRFGNWSTATKTKCLQNSDEIFKYIMLELSRTRKGLRFYPSLQVTLPVSWLLCLRQRSYSWHSKKYKLHVSFSFTWPPSPIWVSDIKWPRWILSMQEVCVTMECQVLGNSTFYNRFWVNYPLFALKGEKLSVLKYAETWLMENWLPTW